MLIEITDHISEATINQVDYQVWADLEIKYGAVRLCGNFWTVSKEILREVKEGAIGKWWALESDFWIVLK